MDLCFVLFVGKDTIDNLEDFDDAKAISITKEIGRTREQVREKYSPVFRFGYFQKPSNTQTRIHQNDRYDTIQKKIITF